MGNMDGRDIVYCLEERTGREVWRFSYDSAAKSYHGTFSSPVIDGGCVYSSGRNGDVHCLDAKTGKRIWHTNVVEKYGAQIPKYGFSGSPVIEGRAVILNACLYGIALDKATGKKIWASPPGRAGYATPVVYDYEGKKGIVVFSHRRLNGVDLRTGERLWQFPWIFNDGADSPDPVVVGSRVFISTAYRNGGAMIEFTGNRPEQHWFKKEIQNEFGSSLYIDGYLYVPVGDTRHRTAYLKCIDFNSGEELWSRDTGHCSMIYADGKFIVLNQWGKLRIMEATDKGWTDLSEADIIETNSRVRCWTAPVLANGRIYVRTCVGDLVCVDVSSSQSSGPITK
jgi:outer membrane protein assembly factor BamB